MENPRTWGKVKYAISDALDEIERQRKEELIGLSDASIIYNYLHERGYIVDDIATTDEEWKQWLETIEARDIKARG